MRTLATLREMARAHELERTHALRGPNIPKRILTHVPVCKRGQREFIARHHTPVRLDVQELYAVTIADETLLCRR